MKNWLRKPKSQRGQSATEYLLMVTVIVGAVLIVGVAIKRFLPNLFDQISQMITGAASSLGGG